MADQDVNIDAFIDGLSEELEPTKPLAHPMLRIAPFFVIAILYVAALVYFVGLRPDLANKLGDASFMLEVFLMSFIAISSGIAAAFLAVPDMRGEKWVIGVPFTALGIFTIWSAIRAKAEGLHMPALHFDHCMGEGMFMSVIPLTMLIMLVRRGATTRPRTMAFMNALAAAGLGYVGLRLTCIMDTVGHATVSHLIPYIAIGMILSFGARKLFKW